MGTEGAAEMASEQIALRLQELEAENARLRADTQASPVGIAPRRLAWRTFGSVVLIVLATVLTPPALVAGWAKAMVVDEGAFVATLAPLAGDPAIQAEVTDRVSAAILDGLNVDEVVGSTFDGLASLDLPPNARSALELLRQPATEGTKSMIRQSVGAVVESDAFEQTWRTSLAASHRAFVAVAQGSVAGGAVALDGQGYVALHLGPVVDLAKDAMVANGMTLAEQIPSTDATIVLADGGALGMVGPLYDFAAALGWWTPLLVLAMFAGGIALARDSRRAVIGSGAGLVIGCGITLVALQVLQTVIAVQAPALGISPAALGALVYHLETILRRVAITLTVAGVGMALLGWLTGASSAALAVQGLIDSGTTRAGRALASHGFGGGRMGPWLGRNRVLVRAALAVLVVALLLATNVSLVSLAWIVVAALLLWWVAAVLEKMALVGTVEVLERADEVELV